MLSLLRGFQNAIQIWNIRYRSLETLIMNLVTIQKKFRAFRYITGNYPNSIWNQCNFQITILCNFLKQIMKSQNSYIDFWAFLIRSPLVLFLGPRCCEFKALWAIFLMWKNSILCVQTVYSVLQWEYCWYTILQYYRSTECTAYGIYKVIVDYFSLRTE